MVVPTLGAVSGTRLEKDDNLGLGLAIQRILEQRGQRVVMTRSTDVSIPLSERSAISNRSNADIFVSLHRNAFANPAAHGVETFVRTNPSPTALQNAQNVQNALVNVGVQSNRGVKQANFAVLVNTRAPSMLVEMGFITNARDNQLFDQNFNEYANAIAGGILQSLGVTSNSRPADGTTFEYSIRAGDTLWLLAQRFGTTIDQIRTLNNLTNDMLTVGRMLRIPTNAITYTVERGDTLWTIAQRFGTTVNTLMSFNNLTTDALHIGQTLSIPR